jgi:hypothetical protein
MTACLDQRKTKVEMTEKDHAFYHDALYLLRGLENDELTRIAENNAKFRDVILAVLAQRNGTHKANMLQSTEAVSPEQTEAPSSAEKQTGTPPSVESPINPESLTPEELAGLWSNPETRNAARAEIVRRLKDDRRKANFLTFRILLPADPADEADWEDAYKGLIGCCWKATMKRLPFGLFPRGYAETYCGKRQRLDGSIAQPAGGVGEETREAIKSALVDCLYELKDLPFATIIPTALNGGFHTDSEVAEVLRRKVRNESRYLFGYGSDVVSNKFSEITLFEVLKENPAGPQPNPYSDTVELIFQEKSKVVEELGEEGWEVIERIVELVDNDLLPPTKRDSQRVLTGLFQTAYGVNERQARTYKSRFQATVRRIFEKVLTKRLGRTDTRNDTRKAPAGEYLPPVVPMEVIERTSGMPVWTRWTDERSSVARDVPPGEWQEIKARLKGEVGDE